jgi:hypothetical protein
MPDDHSDWAEIIYIDPGGTTGWSLMQVHPLALEEDHYKILGNINYKTQGEVSGDYNLQTDELLDLVLNGWPDAAIGIEGFDLRTRVTSPEVLDPVRLTEKITYGLHVAKDPRTVFLHQDANFAKHTATDDRLREWGLYVRAGGLEHARDATRHAIVFLRECKSKPELRKRAWPHLFA